MHRNQQNDLARRSWQSRDGSLHDSFRIVLRRTKVHKSGRDWNSTCYLLNWFGRYKIRHLESSRSWLTKTFPCNLPSYSTESVEAEDVTATISNEAALSADEAVASVESDDADEQLIETIEETPDDQLSDEQPEEPAGK